jgi:ATPase family AAA domain-containing protein 3A/B
MATYFKDFWKFLFSIFFFWKINKENQISLNLKQLEEEFANIILSKDDKERVINLALATKNTKQSGAPYRHVLLHGPPGESLNGISFLLLNSPLLSLLLLLWLLLGTGKTLIARKLAKCSGMDYAILSGGDVAPLAEEAVTQLHALFRWAKKSSKGLLVFIDEAEAFLSSRNHIFGETGASDTHIRNALNALLYQTGTPSTSFMMILATNRPEDLDSAILDRIDVSIQISLPKYEQRLDLIQLYANIHLNSILQKKQKLLAANYFMRIIYYLLYWKYFLYDIEETCLHPTTIEFMAKFIDGFSGREISKLFISLQYGLFLSETYTLTWKTMKDILKNKIVEHYVKMNGFQDFSNHFHLMNFEAEDPVKDIVLDQQQQQKKKGEGINDSRDQADEDEGEQRGDRKNKQKTPKKNLAKK